MLDWATKGRVILGLGTAHMPPDFELYGRPREHRGAILDELMDVIEACWSNAAVRLRGPLLPAQGPRHARALLAHADLDRRPRPEGPQARRRARRRLGLRPAARHRHRGPPGRRVPGARRRAGRALPRGLDRRRRRAGVGAARDEGPPPLLQRRRLPAASSSRGSTRSRRARTSRSTASPRAASCSAPRTRSAPPRPTGSTAPAPTTSRCACATRPARHTRTRWARSSASGAS